MDDEVKNEFDARLELARFWKERHDVRAGFEWKVTLSIWGVLAVAIVSLQGVSRNWIMGLSCVFFLIFYSVWLIGLHHANYIDRKKAYHFADTAQWLLQDSFRPDRKPWPFPWGQWMQLSVTLLLMIILMFVAIPAVGTETAKSGDFNQSITINDGRPEEVGSEQPRKDEHFESSEEG